MLLDRAPFKRSNPWSNVHIAEGGDLQARIDAAAAAYTATGELQQVLVAPGADWSNYVADTAGVLVIDLQQFVTEPVVRYQKPLVRLPYPAAVVVRIDDPEKKGPEHADWWWTTTATLNDPLANNTASSPIEYAQRRGIIITFCVVSSTVGTTPGTRIYLTANDLQRLVWRGHEVASHSYDHTDADNQADEITQVKTSKTQLEGYLADAASKDANATTGVATNAPVESFVIPGDFSRYNDMLAKSIYRPGATPAIPNGVYNARLDRLIKQYYKFCQGYGDRWPGGPEPESERFYNHWDFAIDPNGATWNADVDKYIFDVANSRAGRACTPGLITTIGTHAANYATPLFPTRAQWKYLIDALYAGQKAGWFGTIPMRTAGNCVLQAPANPMKPDTFRGGLAHGLFDLDSVTPLDSTYKSGVYVDFGDNAATMVLNTAFTPVNNLHPWTDNYVLKLVWGAGSGTSLNVFWYRKITPGHTYRLQMDICAPAAGLARDFNYYLQQYDRRTQSDAGTTYVQVTGTDNNAQTKLYQIGDDYSRKGTDAWQTQCWTFRAHPKATTFHFLVYVANKLNTYGLAVANAQLVDLG